MQALSATDAISPAVQRTRNLLFRPFEWGTFLKLCIVAIFTEGLTGNFNFNFPHHNRTTHVEASPFPIHWSPVLIAGIVAAILAGIVIVFVVAYLSVRLRFALFDCLIHQTRQIRPGWRLYRTQAGRFFLLCIGVGVVFLAVLAAVSVPFVFGFLRLYRESQGGHFPIGAFFALVLPLIPVILLVVVAAIATDVILRDFMLPHIALENASAGQAWAAVRIRIAQEKGAFLLYALLRVILPAAVVLGLVIALAIPCLILFGGLALVMGIVHGVLSNATGAAWVLRTFLECLIGTTVVALGCFLAISFGGPLCIAVRNYALLFYGGRYQALGDILSPPPAPAIEPGIA
jgi:hypothetical protein